MDPIFTGILAATLAGLALLIVAGGVAIIKLLKRLDALKKVVLKFHTDLATADQTTSREWTAWKEKIETRTANTEATVTAIHDRITFISNELVPWNARSAAMLEALNVMAAGIDDINHDNMERKMSRTRFIELGDAQPAMGVIENAASFVAPGAEAIPQKPKRVRKPAKKAAKKKAPAKKARKSAKKK